MFPWNKFSLFYNVLPTHVPAPSHPSNTFLQFIEFTNCHGRKFLELAIQCKWEEYTCYDYHCVERWRVQALIIIIAWPRDGIHRDNFNIFFSQLKFPSIIITTVQQTLHTTATRSLFALILNKWQFETKLTPHTCPNNPQWTPKLPK